MFYGKRKQADAGIRREAVRLALTSGRRRREIAEDLGIGLSTLTRWLSQERDDSEPIEARVDVHAELKRLRRENVVLKEERDIIKTVPGWGPPVRGRNSLCYRCDMKGSGRSLIGGLGIVRNPVKNVVHGLMRT